MKRVIAATVGAVVVSAVLMTMLLFSARNLRPMEPSSRPTEEYTRLRELALSRMPEDIGLKLRPGDGQPFAILMETGFSEGTATLVALSTGEASLYFSNGGGVIGGFAHKQVRVAARQFVDSSKQFLPVMSQTDSFPLPEVGMTQFYVRTTSGVLTARARDSDLFKGRSELSPLYREGHQVITELREIAEQRESKP